LVDSTIPADSTGYTWDGDPSVVPPRSGEINLRLYGANATEDTLSAVALLDSLFYNNAVRVVARFDAVLDTAAYHLGNETPVSTSRDSALWISPWSDAVSGPLYEEDFEDGVGAEWTLSSVVNTTVDTSSSYSPRDSYHLILVNDTGNAATITKTADLEVDLSGQTSIRLVYWAKKWCDNCSTMDAFYFGVDFSDDSGSSWTEVHNYQHSTLSDDVYTQYTVDIDSVATAEGLSLTSDFLIRFRHRFWRDVPDYGFAYDDISIVEE